MRPRIDSRLVTLLRQGYPDLYGELSRLAEREGLSISAAVAEGASMFIENRTDGYRDILLELDKRIMAAKKKNSADLAGIIHSMGGVAKEASADDLIGWVTYFE